MSTKFVLIFLVFVGYPYGQGCLQIISSAVDGQCPDHTVDFSGTCCIIDPAYNCDDTMEVCPSMEGACKDPTAGLAVQQVCPYTCGTCNVVNPTNSDTTALLYIPLHQQHVSTRSTHLLESPTVSKINASAVMQPTNYS